MSSTIEDLAVELWFDIFLYLKISDQFQAFFNLNKRLNDILLVSPTKISCKNDDEEAQYLLRYVLPNLTHRYYVTGLRLEAINKIDLKSYGALFNFHQLDTLILHRLNINEDFLDVFQQNLFHLRDLNISPKVSMNKKTMSTVLEMILCLPNLQICRMHLKLSMSHFLLDKSIQSSIRYLRLSGTNGVCYIDRLMHILQHLPYLQSLYITANQLNFIHLDNLMNTNTYQTSISNLTLNINELVIPLVELTDFISNLTPYLQKLKLTCRTHFQNTSYLDCRIWKTFVKSLPELKNIHLKFCYTSHIDGTVWNDRCILLTQLMAKNLIDLHIHSIS
ncbi:hypothetical protein I4U23_019488 [Adineta vaga]|nr:hypothetical protein I4U23_019488 [Adineta vaga]